MNEKYLPLLATIVVFSALFITGGILYKNFLSTLVLGDILADNAFVIIAAIGTTFVILSGGIDLSIGSMIGFVGVVMANLDGSGWHPLASGANDAVLRPAVRRACRGLSSTSARSSRSSSRSQASSCCAAAAS